MTYLISTEVLFRRVSPDGELTLLVLRQQERDGTTVLSLGFEEYGWHVHPDGFPANCRTGEQVLLDLADDITNDRMIIMFESYRDGDPQPNIMDSIEFEIDFYQPGTKWLFRFWSGRVVSVDDLMDGKVEFKPFGHL